MFSLHTFCRRLPLTNGCWHQPQFRTRSWNLPLTIASLICIKSRLYSIRKIPSLSNVMHNCWCINAKRMEIYNDLYTQRVAYYQHFGQLILNCVFLIQVKFPKINWKYFNSTPAVRTLPRIGVVASMSILYVVLSQYVPTLFAFAYHCPISDQFHGQQQKHLINVLVLVLILETQPQQEGIWTVQSLEIPTNISRPMSFPF